MRRQAYVLPVRGGWAVNVHGDDVIPDGSTVLLPLTERVTYGDALRFVASTDVGRGAYVDGWPSRDELRRCEPGLFHETEGVGG